MRTIEFTCSESAAVASDESAIAYLLRIAVFFVIVMMGHESNCTFRIASFSQLSCPAESLADTRHDGSAIGVFFLASFCPTGSSRADPTDRRSTCMYAIVGLFHITLAKETRFSLVMLVSVRLSKLPGQRRRLSRAEESAHYAVSLCFIWCLGFSCSRVDVKNQQDPRDAA